MPTSKNLSGEACGEVGHAAARRHGRGYSHHGRILFREFAENLAENILIAVGLILSGRSFSCLGVELAGGVPGGRVGLRRRVALALDCAGVQDFRTLDVLQPPEGLDNLLDVVSVDRAEVPESERFE